MKTAVKFQLSLMMFLEFFIWGGWFVTLGTFLGNNLGATGSETAMAFSTQSWGAIIAPFIIGLIADRFFPSQVVMGVLFLLGGALLLLVPSVAQSGDSSLMVWLMLGNMLCYMPTLGLGNTIQRYEPIFYWCNYNNIRIRM